jgi:hypothetical protein
MQAMDSKNRISTERKCASILKAMTTLSDASETAWSSGNETHGSESDPPFS